MGSPHIMLKAREPCSGNVPYRMRLIGPFPTLEISIAPTLPFECSLNLRSSGWDKTKQSASRQAVWTSPLHANGTEVDLSSSQRTVRQPHTSWAEVPGKLAVGTPEGEAPYGGQREALKPIINSPRAQAPPQASPSHRSFRSPESPGHPKVSCPSKLGRVLGQHSFNALSQTSLLPAEPEHTAGACSRFACLR